MSAGNRRGFTLVELLVALIMLVVVGGALYRLLITVQRVSGRQTEVSNLQGNLRAGMQLVQSELSEVFTNAGAGTSDILGTLSSTAIRYRAMRGLGETCEITTSYVKVRTDNFNGRLPTAGTSRLFFLWDRDSTKVTDDQWLDLPITAVSSSTCPDGITPATTLSVTLTADQRDSTYVPSVVRTWEEMEIGQVTDGGQRWLGIRSVTAGETALVPVIGPLEASGNGVNFTYLGDNNWIAATPSTVKSIVVTLRGVTDRRVNTGVGSAQGTVSDSLQFRIQLRNSQ